MISPHTVKAFDAELQEVTCLLTEMSHLAGSAIRDAVAALLRLDAESARRVIGRDRAIDDLQREIESRAIVMIARRQPVAVDLRQIVGALRIANDLERIGDLAKNIAKRAIALDRRRGLDVPADAVAQMAELVVAQLNAALAGFLRRDRDSAIAACRSDREVDHLHGALSGILLERMSEESADLAVGIHYLFCAKNLEHMGDHAANIAKTVFYVIEGQTLTESALEMPTARWKEIGAPATPGAVPRPDAETASPPLQHRDAAAGLPGEGTRSTPATERRDLAAADAPSQTGASDR